MKDPSIIAAAIMLDKKTFLEYLCYNIESTLTSIWFQTKSSLSKTWMEKDHIESQEWSDRSINKLPRGPREVTPVESM
jgi:hypothetical protein